MTLTAEATLSLLDITLLHDGKNTSINTFTALLRNQDKLLAYKLAKKYQTPLVPSLRFIKVTMKGMSVDTRTLFANFQNLTRDVCQLN